MLWTRLAVHGCFINARSLSTRLLQQDHWLVHLTKAPTVSNDESHWGFAMRAGQAIGSCPAHPALCWDFHNWPGCTGEKQPQRTFPCMPRALRWQWHWVACPTAWPGRPSFMRGHLWHLVTIPRAQRKRRTNMQRWENCPQKWQSLCVHWWWSLISLYIAIFLFDFFLFNVTKAKEEIIS